MNKMSKTAKTLDVFFKIMQIVAKILFVACIVCIAILGAALLFDLDPNMIGTGYNIMDLGSVEITLAETVAPAPQMVLIHALIGLVLGLVNAIIMIKAVKCIRDILSPVVEGKPFHDTVSTNLKKLGWLTIGVGIANNVVELVNNAVSVLIYKLPDLLLGLFKDGSVTHLNINSQLDLTFLVAAGMLFLMSCIFSYGQQLQQLSDETL